MRSLFMLALLAGTALAAPPAWTPGEPVPAGPLLARPVAVSVFLRSDTPPAEAQDKLARLAHDSFVDVALAPGPGAKGASNSPRGPGPAGPAGYGLALTPDKQPLPPEDAFLYAARRLPPDEVARVRGAHTVQVLTFVIDPARRSDLASVCALAHALAEATGAVLEDGQTRELFTLAQWKAARLDSWQGAIPAVPGHIAIRPRQDASGAGVDTVGLDRFGLPDLTISGLQPHDVPAAATLLVLAAQQLVERPQLDRAGQLAVHATALLHAAMRTRAAPGAPGTTTLDLRVAPPSPLSPRRIAIVPSAGDRTAPAMLARAVRETTGQGEEATLSAEADAELTAASARAQPRIAELRKLYHAKPPPGAELLVKAPFAAKDGGREWMWVQVERWEAGRIFGTLLNAPSGVPGLAEGESITVPDGELFDYRYAVPGQPPEGGETDRVIEQRTR